MSGTPEWEPDFSISMEVPELPEDTVSLKPETVPEPEPETHPPEPAATKTPKRAKRDLTVLIAEVRRRLVGGDSDLAITEDLDLTAAEYRRVKAKMYAAAVDGFAGKTAEEQYVDYRLEQERCMAELDEMIKHFKSTKQYNAMVGAVRAKSQIMADIHKTGVRMGVIKQEASYDREVAGVRIAELSNKDLRETIAGELRGLKGIIERFGDKPMTEHSEPSPMADPSMKRVKQ
jgi:hypothetical protein